MTVLYDPWTHGWRSSCYSQATNRVDTVRLDLFWAMKVDQTVQIVIKIVSCDKF